LYLSTAKKILIELKDFFGGVKNTENVYFLFVSGISNHLYWRLLTNINSNKYQT